MDDFTRWFLMPQMVGMALFFTYCWWTEKPHD